MADNKNIVYLVDEADDESGQSDNMSKQELLDEITQAIRVILTGGQYYRIGSRELRRANLAELRAMKKELEAEIKAENSNGIGRRSAAVFFDRR